MFVVYFNKTSFNNCNYYTCIIVYKIYKFNNVAKIIKIYILKIFN